METHIILCPTEWHRCGTLLMDLLIYRRVDSEITNFVITWKTKDAIKSSKTFNKMCLGCLKA